MIDRPKQPELPPQVARALMEDMRAYYAEPNEHKRNEIAARQPAHPERPPEAPSACATSRTAFCTNSQ